MAGYWLWRSGSGLVWSGGWSLSLPSIPPNLLLVHDGTAYVDQAPAWGLDLDVAAAAVVLPALFTAGANSDVFMFDTQPRFFLHVGSTFADASAAVFAGVTIPHADPAVGAVTADIDGSGSLDVLVAFDNQPLLVLLNDLQGGSGRFLDASVATPGAVPTALVTGALAPIDVDLERPVHAGYARYTQLSLSSISDGSKPYR